MATAMGATAWQQRQHASVLSFAHSSVATRTKMMRSRGFGESLPEQQVTATPGLPSTLRHLPAQTAMMRHWSAFSCQHMQPSVCWITSA